jgi:hypothetical protein
VDAPAVTTMARTPSRVPSFAASDFFAIDGCVRAITSNLTQTERPEPGMRDERG